MTTAVCCLASSVQLLVLYVLGGLAGSCTHLAYCWYDAGGEGQPATCSVKQQHMSTPSGSQTGHLHTRLQCHVAVLQTEQRQPVL